MYKAYLCVELLRSRGEPTTADTTKAIEVILLKYSHFRTRYTTRFCDTAPNNPCGHQCVWLSIFQLTSGSTTVNHCSAIYNHLRFDQELSTLVRPQLSTEVRPETITLGSTRNCQLWWPELSTTVRPQTITLGSTRNCQLWFGQNCQPKFGQRLSP